MTFGFFNDSAKFRYNLIYWHIIPSCTAMGFKCPGKDIPASIASYMEGFGYINQFVFAFTAAELAKCRHEFRTTE